MSFLPLEIDGEKVYAGFWKRLLAALVDSFVFMPLVFLWQKNSFEDLFFNTWLYSIIFALLFWGYVVFFHYKFGATIGKITVGVKVALPGGQPIGLKEALLRSSVDFLFLLIISSAVVIAMLRIDYGVYEGFDNFQVAEKAEYMNGLIPSWHEVASFCNVIWTWSELLVLLLNKRKRALHDFIAGTVVICKQYTEQAQSSEAAEKIQGNP